ncbi:MAG TPA: tetratricopeptide repeat protein [Chloroflexia bacterium]|nr:tetratricopeptide repeat protein [Chloroflexia bacterium]
MAEVNQGFDAAMRRGREFVAAGDWAKALNEFIRAAQSAPSDITARYNLALALFKLGHNDQAYQQFQGITRLQPQNTEAWMRIAEIQAATNKRAEAVQTLQRVKEIHKKAQKQREVAEVLREIIKVDPAQVEAYRELADIAKARGERKAAASIITNLGQYFQAQGRTQDALSAANEALLLQPDYQEALTLREQANPHSIPAGLEGLAALPSIDLLSNGNGGTQTPARNGSGMIARVSASEYTINQLINTAEEALARGDTGLALRNYELAVEEGVNRADVFYSIGQLYAQNGQVEQAVDYLTRASNDHDYAASSFFTMGQVYDEAGRLDEAANAYRDALDRIDLQTIGRDEIDELIEMYEALGKVLEKQEKVAEAADVYNRLAQFINNKNLRTERTALVIIHARELSDKVAERSSAPASPVIHEEEEALTSSIRFGSEESLVHLTGNEENPGIGDGKTATGSLRLPIGAFANSNGAMRAPVINTPTIPARFPTNLVALEPRSETTPWLRAAEEFMRTDRLTAATDACQEIIRYYPDYIPAQAILAEISVAQERLEQARSKYQLIVDLYQVRGDQTKSVECYKRLAEISPDNMGLRSKLANVLLQSNQKEEAAELLLSTIGNYARTGQLERALEECKRLRGLAPQSAPIRVQYAELLIRMDRYNEAMPELRAALELDPNNLKALALLNISSFLIGDSSVKWNSFQTVVEKARKDENSRKLFLEEYRQAAMLYNHPGVFYAYGCLYLDSSQSKQAERVLAQALEQSGPAKAEFEPLIHWSLGQIYLEQHRSKEAVEELTQATGLVDRADPALYAASSASFGTLPNQIQLHRKMAQAYAADGNPAEAVKALKTVKKLTPYNREIHRELADLYFNQGQLNEALSELGELVAHYDESGKVDEMIEVLREMAELAPNNMGVKDKLSEVYLKRGMIDAGLKELDELAELQRKNGRLKDAVRTLQRAAETYWMMGKMDPAYELYDRIVRISPGDVEARQQLVNRHLMSGRVADAVEEQRTIAQICLQSNNTQEAIAALHQVIGLAPEDMRAYFQLANVLSSTNEHYQAYRLYQRVLRLDPKNEKARQLMEQAQRNAVEAGQMKQ